MKSGKRYLTDGMEPPNQAKIRTLAENETYKYLSILEADAIKVVEIKIINNISHDKTRTWLRKGNFKRETESLLIAVPKRRNKIANIGYVVTGMKPSIT